MDDEEYEEQQATELESANWSWPGVAAEFSLMIAHQITAVAEFVESIAVQFMRVHNKFVDDCDREKFATDFMSGLKDL